MSESIYEKLEKARKDVKMAEFNLEIAKGHVANSKKRFVKLAYDIVDNHERGKDYAVETSIFWMSEITRQIKLDEDRVLACSENLRIANKQLTKLERRFYATNVGPYLTYECSGEDFDYERLLKGFIKGTKL